MMVLQSHKENNHGKRTATEKQGSKETQEGNTQVTGLLQVENQGRESRMKRVNCFLLFLIQDLILAATE